jgi:hypothetical protein
MKEIMTEEEMARSDGCLVIMCGVSLTLLAILVLVCIFLPNGLPR